MADPAGEELTLAVKAFGKDGVRLCWQLARSTPSTDTMEIQMRHTGPWITYSSLPIGNELSGVTVVKNAGSRMPVPRSVTWRLRVGKSQTAGVRVGGKSGGGLEEEGGGSLSACGGGAEESAAPLERRAHASGAEVSDETLQQHLDTALCLLRVELNASTLELARTSVADALAFDDQLSSLSSERGISKGLLFQSLLEELRQAGATHAQLDNSAGKIEGAGIRSASSLGISLSVWSKLCLQADALRNLVRIKIADDNDLQTARRGLEECAACFAMVSAAAAQRGITESAMLEALAPFPLS